MSWLRIDDRFTEHPKVLLLSDAALAFWVKVSCWLQRNPKFGGFIPAALLPEITRKPPDEAIELSLQLVNARAGGLYDVGLWIPCEGGFRVHDWDDYQLSPEETEQRRTARVEAGRRGGNRSAKLRREASFEKTEAERPDELKQNQANFKQTSSKAQANAKQTPKQSSSKREANTQANAQAKSNPVPVPVPVPDQLRSKAVDVVAKDLTGSARDEDSDAEDRVPPPASTVLPFPSTASGSSGIVKPQQRVTSAPQSGLFDQTAVVPQDRNPTRPDNAIPEPPTVEADRPLVASDPSPSRRTSTRTLKTKAERFVPEDWQPHDGHRARAEELGVSFNLELQKFRCHEYRIPKTDWNRAFFGWLGNAASFGTSSGGKSFGSSRAPKMGEPGWRRQPDAGAVNDADYEYDYSKDEVSNG
jgi:hypothetical protein